MKKITLALILSLLSFNSYSNQGVQFNDFSNNFEKGKYLQNRINQELLGKVDKCETVSRFLKLDENSDILFLQVSCKNIQDDFQVLLSKKHNLSTVNTCTEAKKKYSEETRCRQKL